MKANPGGQIDLDEVVGRDEIIDEIWDTLEVQSIRLSAERRIGKTTIIKKLCAEPRSGWVPIFQDLEQYHTAIEFATAVYRAVDKFLSRGQKTARRARKLIESVSGAEVGGLLKLPPSIGQEHWKQLLSDSIQDLVEERGKKNERPLFLWDEVPFMVANIKDREGEPVALEVLDLLRGLRQTYGGRGLRMILTGSIGLHHVLNALKHQSTASSPVNDTLAIEVPVLDEESARELATKLIEGEKIQTHLLEETADAVAQVSDGFPFYIHHIVRALKQSRRDGSPLSVEQVVTEQLSAASDPWELNHYRKRIPIYYGQESEAVVLGILDSVATSSDAMSIDELFSTVKSSVEISDRDQLIEILRLIAQDHYLVRNGDGHFEFKFSLIRRWWKLTRGL